MHSDTPLGKASLYALCYEMMRRVREGYAQTLVHRKGRTVVIALQCATEEECEALYAQARRQLT